MAYGVILEFTGTTQQQYDKVNELLGLDAYNQADPNWPDGMISHAGGMTGEGLCVFEIWKSSADHAKFMDSRLGAALAGAEIPAPARVTEVDLFNHQVM